MRVIFCGTPEIAVPSLQALSKIAEIVGVVCQPDRPAGRGMKLTAPAVKVEALSAGFEVFQPVRVRDGSLAAWMRDKEADLALVIAYGRILTEETLRAPRLGCLNLHASLLPEYRGAAPIQRVLMDGRNETGVCLMHMDAGMDTGAVLARRALPISHDDNAGSLAMKLGALAATMTHEELPRFFRGELSATPQEESRATYAPPIEREDTVIDFQRPAEHIVAQIRGLSPRPGASCLVPGERPKRFKITSAAVDESIALQPGEVAVLGQQLLIGTAKGGLRVDAGQIEGKNSQSGADLVRGRAILPGHILGGKV